MKNLKKNMTTFKPMLAHPVSKTIDWKNQTHFIQPKLDGVRCIITRHGAYSRNNKQFYNCKRLPKDLVDRTSLTICEDVWVNMQLL